MIIEEIKPSVFHIKFQTQYLLTSTFMRIQEYYESPFKTIRNQVFTCEDFMDLYASESGGFTYFTDWSGFNVPDNIVRKFDKQYKNIMIKKEARLFQTIKANILYYDRRKFYIIATNSEINDAKCIRHELAHAYYYLKPSYRNKMNDLNHQNKWKKQWKIYLLDKGYCEDMIDDEIQAYCATDNTWDFNSRFPITKGLYNYSKNYRDLFDEYINK